MEASLQYPIGTFDAVQPFSEQMRNQWISEMSKLPGDVSSAVRGLTDEQLNTPYRPNGWTIRQVVHHVPDSHMNSYIRFKLALTEEQPTIKPYQEDQWARLSDYKDTPIETSLSLLSSLHQRWVLLLQSMDAQQFQRTFLHPEAGVMTLDYAVGLYAWHGKHHLAQITTLKNRLGW